MALPFLTNHGILGMNARNLLYIRPYNPRRAIALADDKIKAKAYLSARGVPTAKVFAHVVDHAQLKDFDFSTLPDQCVLKPNYGFGGEGIKVFKGRKGKNFVEGKNLVSAVELREHIERILEGEFSVNGREDTAFFEQLLIAHEGFDPFRPAGLPDVRIVVFNLVPIMAMLRIPTIQSQGKANVHLGGIGIGVDLAKGVTTHATQYNRLIERLPSGADVRGHKIPFWDQLLLIAAKIQQATDIGYLAVDLTIDDKSGPMLLEVNARAGLMVQVANLAPLRSRLDRVQGLHVSTPEKGVLLAQEMFGQKIAPKSTVQKDVLGLHEMVQIQTEDGELTLPALIHPRFERTIFAPSLVQELVALGAIELQDAAKQTYRVRFTLAAHKIQTVVRSREIPEHGVRVSLGRRDLTQFLIDPARSPAQSGSGSARLTMNMFAVDRLLADIDRSLPILGSLKPVNIEQERMRALTEEGYQPHFTYAPLKADMDEARRKLEECATDDSPLGLLLEKKRTELLRRAAMLSARGNAGAFTRASVALFGTADATLVAHAQAFLDGRIACDLPPRFDALLDAASVKDRFEAVIADYGLHDWTVEIRENLVSDCAVGKRYVFIRADTLFEPAHVDALIAHELEAHALCAENASTQPYRLLQQGTAGYLMTQEGLAIHLQNRVLPPHHDKRTWAARGVLAVQHALTADFRSLRTQLEELGFTREKALSKALSLKRGLADTAQPGCFTKDLAYFCGQRMIDAFVVNGGDLKRLYIGRVSLEDLPLIEHVPDLKKPILLPRFLRGG